MPLLASYSSRASAFHRLDPLTKLVWMVAAVGACFALDSIPAGLVIVALVVGSSRAARLNLRAFVPMTWVFVALALGMIVVQTLFSSGGEVLYRFGPAEIHSQGPYLAIRGTLKLYCTALLALQFTMWTHPSELGQALTRAGFPYRYAMLVGLALRFLPVMEKELESIFDAQEARGVDLRGPLRRALSLVPITVPFCLRTLRRSDEVALAMELRAYGYLPRRVPVKAIEFRRVDLLLTAVIVAVLAAALAVRLGLRVPGA